MARPTFKDRVRETTATTGTGTLTLGGAASGFQSFQSAVGNAGRCCFMTAGAGDWELALGVLTVSTVNTLTRATVLASSNSGSAVSFSAGQKDVFLVDPSLMFNQNGLPVELFGAKGDGATDDTATIQDAIDSVGIAGGTVIFGEGKDYRVTGLTVEADNVRLLGHGYGSRITNTHGSNHTITIGASTVRAGVVIENLLFKPSVTRTGSEIDADNFVNLRISNCRFSGDTGIAIFCITLGKTTGQNVIAWLTNLRADNFTRFLYLVRCLDVWVANCSTDANIAGSTSVILEGGVQSCDFVNCDFVNSAASPTGNAMHAKAVDYAAQAPSYCHFTNCYFDSHSGGLLADAMVDCAFTNCWFSARPGSGVVIANAACSSLNFVNCQFENCGDHGLVMNAGTNILVQGCSAISNNQGAGGEHGLAVGAGLSGGFRFLGNRCYNRAAFGGAQAYGIFIGAGTTNFVVADNDTRGNATGGISGPGATATEIYDSNLGA